MAFREEYGTSQALASKYHKAGKKVAIMIAGNAGLPGGGLGNEEATGLKKEWEEIKTKDYPTQEENVLVDWLKWAESNGKDPDSYFKTKLGSPRKWGLLYNPRNVLSKKTVQGDDFSLPLVRRDGTDRSDYYDFAHSLPDEGILYEGTSVPVQLVFVFGPNVAAGTKDGDGMRSMYRTRVTNYRFDDHYSAFRKSVFKALRAGMLEMAMAGTEVGILARVSGGIYAGKGRTRKFINEEYSWIIEQIIADEPTLQGMTFIMPNIDIDPPDGASDDVPSMLSWPAILAALVGVGGACAAAQGGF